jgi:phosphoribosyl-AMP cyclohydrolase
MLWQFLPDLAAHNERSIYGGNNLSHSSDNAMLEPYSIEMLKYDQNGLLPAVIQDHRNNAVLMVGYMNSEALRRTVSEGRVCFWSRSRREYWVKGETSGNIFQVKAIYTDCDADTLLVRVLPLGPGVACHTGRYSCFYNNIAGFSNEENGND